jgi:hypothetical protein
MTTAFDTLTATVSELTEEQLDLASGGLTAKQVYLHLLYMLV